MLNYQRHFTLDEILPRFSKTMQDKIIYSVTLIRRAEPLAIAYDPINGYYNTFSGGKDSQVLYHLMQIAGVKHRTHMNLTSVDPPEVIRFVRTQYPDVELIKPKDSIYHIAIKRKFLPTMITRWCCQEYKEGAGAGKVTTIGIRHAESVRRSRRREVEVSSRKYSGSLEGLDAFRQQRNATRRGRHRSAEINITNATGERTLGCIRGRETLLISPIIHWADQEVWTFLDTLGITHCCLYDEGRHRIGCINCPMSSAHQIAIDAERWPHVKQSWIRAIMRIRANGGYSPKSIFGHVAQDLHLPDDPADEAQQLHIANLIYDWWCSRKSYAQWISQMRTPSLFPPTP